MEKSRHPSLRKLYRNIVLIVIPLGILICVLFMHVRNAILNQVLNSSHAEIEKEISSLDSICSSANYTLIRMLSSSQEIKMMMEKDPYEQNAANIELQTEFRAMRQESLGVCNYFFYDMQGDKLILPVREYANVREEYEIRDKIYQIVRNKSMNTSSISKAWTLCLMEQEQDDFILKICQNGDAYMGCWIPLDSIYNNFGANDYSGVGRMMFLAQGNEIVTGKAKYRETSQTETLIVNSKNPRALRNNQEISWYSFDRGDFALVFSVNVLDNFQSVQNMLFLLIAVLVFALLAGIFLLIYMQKKLLGPVQYFVDNLSLENILKMNEDSEEYTPYFQEMAQVDKMFKDAAEQIVELKFAMYEQEMEKNQIEMEYLQKQIKPHFYLNCMNVIYNMAELGKMNEIKQFSREMSEYLRGIFQSSNEPITIREEIDHVKKYLDINKIRYDDEFETEISVEEDLNDCTFMPLIIHTFVENSIKHALYGKNKLKICIVVETCLLEKEAYVHVRVSDNGDGYSEDVLASLNEGESLTTKDGKRVGLSNAAKRIKVFWSGKARLSFSNEQSGGAVEEIWFPKERTRSKNE